MRPAIAPKASLATWRGSFVRLVSNSGEGVQAMAAVELAIIAPVLALMLVASFDLGMGIYRKMQVQTAAEAGAQYVIEHGFSSSIASVVTNATSFAGISATPAPSRFCGCVSSTGIATAACSSMCPDGTVAGTYVTVSSQATYTTILPYPIVPNSFALSSQSTVRIQ